MPTRKILSTGNVVCKDREHSPFEDRGKDDGSTGKIVNEFPTGLYEHTCPTCGEVTHFRVTVQRV